jgi:hypothetical protein
MLMELGNLVYNYDAKRGKSDSVEKLEELKANILKIVQENDMAELYSSLSEKFDWTIDEELLSALRKKNEDELAAIEVKIADAGINAGDTEVN